MITWFINSRIGKWLAAIGAAVAILAGAVLLGWTKRGQREAARKLEGYKDTRRRIDDADDIHDDPATLRDWLRERGKR